MPGGDFTEHLYDLVPGWDPYTVNGVRGEVIKNITDKAGLHTSLPLGAGTSNIYFRLGRNGEIVQGRLYIHRISYIDFDWGHNHYINPAKGGDGTQFPKGVVHVQPNPYTGTGSTRLSHSARYMTEEEIEKYGPLIHHFAPTVKFKP